MKLIVQTAWCVKNCVRVFRHLADKTFSERNGVIVLWQGTGQQHCVEDCQQPDVSGLQHKTHCDNINPCLLNELRTWNGTIDLRHRELNKIQGAPRGTASDNREKQNRLTWT